MAQKVNIILVDDLDGGPADENVRFGLDGTNYDIDLSAANAAELRTALERFIAAGRKSSGGRTARTKAPSSGVRGNESAQIRQWARDNGYTVNSRGRIQAEIQEAYHRANS